MNVARQRYRLSILDAILFVIIMVSWSDYFPVKILNLGSSFGKVLVLRLYQIVV